MKGVLFLFLLFSSIFNAIGNGINTIDFIEVEDNKTWKSVFKRAKEEGKIVFVDVYTDWCGYCHKLDKEVYTDQNVVDYFNAKFINVKFDAETDFGRQKAYQYAIDGYPTLLFLTTEEKVFEEIGGFVPSTTLLAYAEQVQEGWALLPTLTNKLENESLTADEQLTYIGILEKTNYEEAARVASDYISSLTAEDYMTIENLWLVSRFENQLSSSPFQYISTHKEKIISTHGTTEYEDYMKAVYNDNLELAIRYGELKLLNQLIAEVLPEFAPVNQLPELAYISKSIYYGQRQEYEKYIFENKAYINNHLLEEDKRDWLIQKALEVINSFENKTMHEHALELLQQSISIDDQNFQSQALAGYTCGLLSDFNNAKRYLSEASVLAEGQEEKEIFEGIKQAVEEMKG